MMYNNFAWFSGEPDPIPPEAQTPKWCFCGRCVPMQKPMEEVCCRRTHGQCTLSLNAEHLEAVVLNRGVLHLAILSRNDIFNLRRETNNCNLRFASYRQYVLWAFGKLGKGNRVVIPSCVLNKIRAKFPAPVGEQYKGFVPADLHI